MCGIAGVWDPVADATLSDMTAALAHRGPDAEGVFRSPGGGLLGHRRLSIVDLAGGDQPILAGDGTRAVVANGEIYNAPTLRPALAARHTFATRSDTEVALHLYDEHGAGFVEHLDGMYAIAIADGPDLVLARDPVGVKPLYYTPDGDCWLFASELKAFPPGTGGVREFPPGTVFSSAQGFATFYSVPDPEPAPAGEGTHAARVRAALEAAVTKRLMSDVPVGAF
ncbi:MAG: asparagine synthetase B family protein, partial [Acidimicrobiia bacterium]